ncbi:MAG: ABC transporter substrate-binding protein [Ilumatobacter sp.]
MNKRIQKTVAAMVVFGGVAAACGSDSVDDAIDAVEDAAEDAVEDVEEAVEDVEEAAEDAVEEVEEAVEDAMDEAVCPSNLVIQTDWWPESEHGGTYNMVNPEGASADASLFTYSGPIKDAYKVGGIETVEVRAGGDAIEFQPVVSVMQTDRDITLGYVNTDDAFQSSGTVQVTGVATTLEKNPQMLQWDPTQTEIDPDDPTTIAASGARILHFPGTTYIDWMIAQGYMTEDQSDPNYGGAPDQWISSGGDFIQQGFVTNEIYKYENDIPWKDDAPADVEFAIIHDLGWQPYPAMYSVLTERLDELSPCLEVLVPALQQSWVDYLADPAPVGDQIIAVTEEYNNFWTLSPGLNEAAFGLFDSEEIATNGGDDTYGNFDPARVETLFEEIGGVLDARGIEMADGMTADSVYTNEFIDESIGR